MLCNVPGPVTVGPVVKTDCSGSVTGAVDAGTALRLAVNAGDATSWQFDLVDQSQSGTDGALVELPNPALTTPAAEALGAHQGFGSADVPLARPGATSTCSPTTTPTARRRRSARPPTRPMVRSRSSGRPPTAQDDTASTLRGRPVRIDVRANDDAGYDGRLSIDYVGEPAGGTATATVRVEVLPPAPVARNDRASTSSGEAVVIDVTGNDDARGGDALTISGTGQARNARSCRARTAELTHLAPPMTPGERD